MCTWTLDKNDQIIDNLEIKELGIFKLPNKPLYHYTSREVFWKIIESETLLARHIMFSNDMEENQIGTQKVKQIMEENNMVVEDIEALPFMVCFCEKEDLLSQWRGYANEGIALEFDFSKGLHGILGYENTFSPYHCFTIMNNDEYKEYEYTNKFWTIKDGKREQKTYFMGVITAPYNVIYVDKGVNGDEEIRNTVKKIIKKCEEPELRSQRIANLIPYIKNDKFEEESEYRLIFNMTNLLQEDKQQILEQKYVNLEVSGIRKPNIRVKFGNQMDSEKEEIYIYYNDDVLNDLLENMGEELKKNSVALKLVKDVDAIEESEMIVSNGKYQAEICTLLRQKLRQYSGGTKKIWCDGHLPIRKIIVGPSKDAEYMVRSIEEYKKTKYWMRDIKVEISQIPLRT